MEQKNREVLVESQKNYPGALNGQNLTDIIKAARAKLDIDP